MKKILNYLILILSVPLIAKDEICPNLPSWNNQFSKETSIAADIVEINGNNELVLNGNAKILSADNSINAKEANILKEGNDFSGFFKNGSFQNNEFKAIFELGNIQDSGETLSFNGGQLQRKLSPLEFTFEKLDKFSNAYEMEKVIISSCNEKDFGWAIKGEHVSLKNSGRGSITNMELEVFGKSLFWLPWVPFAATTERLTGFLEPKIGLGSEGLDISLPYFLVLNNKSDITIAPRRLADRGNGFENNFRFLSRNVALEIDGIFLDEDKKFKFLPTLANNRWASAIRAQGESSNASFFIDWAKASDFLVLQNLPTFVANIGIDRSPYLLQNIYLNYKTENFLIALRKEDAQLLDPGITKSISKNPEIEINYFKSNQNIEFKIEAIHSRFTQYQGFFEMPEISLMDEDIFRNYMSAEIKVFHNFKKWMVEASHTSTHRSYSKKDIYLPNTTRVGSSFLGISTYLNHKNKSLILKPFLQFKHTPYEEYGRLLILDGQFKNDSVYDLRSNTIISGRDISLDERSLATGLEFQFDQLKAQFQGMIAIKKNLRDSKILEKYFADQKIPDEQLLIDTSLISEKTAVRLSIDYDFDNSKMRYGNLSMQKTIGDSIFKIAQNKRLMGDIHDISKLNFREYSILTHLKDNYQAFVYHSEDLLTKKKMDSYIGIGYENCCIAWRLFARDKRLTDINYLEQNNQLFIQDSWKEMISYENKSRITFEIELKGLMSPSKKIQRVLDTLQ
jgi:lipopolysaccharide assembly outer membrane protein LptD (OstA)